MKLRAEKEEPGGNVTGKFLPKAPWAVKLEIGRQMSAQPPAGKAGSLTEKKTLA